ncbi:uncharacterized protein LOC144887083 [Branchiostoma floridae x Branchiostoma japonicum]
MVTGGSGQVGTSYHGYRRHRTGGYRIPWLQEAGAGPGGRSRALERPAGAEGGSCGQGGGTGQVGTGYHGYRRLGLAREDAVERWRDLLGPKEVPVAKEEAPDSLRAQFAVEDVPINQLHGSDVTFTLCPLPPACVPSLLWRTSPLTSSTAVM